MKAFIFALIASFAIPTIALSARQSFEQGNQLAAEGKWTEAIASYGESLRSGGPAFSILYNLGNAHHAAGESGKAILAWERARIASPRDPDIANNLALARRETGTTEPAPKVWRAPAFWLSLNDWAVVGSLALAVMAALAVSAALGVKLRVPRRGLSLAAMLAAVLSVSAIYLRADESNRAIVVTATGAAVRISPFAQARLLVSLPPGSTVHVLRKHGGHTQVMTGDGAKGWIKATEATLVRQR